MRINNYDYNDLMMRYSRAARALKSGNAETASSCKLDNSLTNPVKFDSVLVAVENSREFDSVIAEAAKFYVQREKSGQDKILTFVAKKLDGPDTLLIEASYAYSQAKNTSGRYDSVLRGEIS